MRKRNKVMAAIVAFLIALVGAVTLTPMAQASSGSQIFNCGAVKYGGVCPNSNGADIYVVDDSGWNYRIGAGYWSYPNVKGFWIDNCWEGMNNKTGSKFPGGHWYWLSSVPNTLTSLSKYRVC